MVEFCREHGIKHDVCGKVIVATKQEELLAEMATLCWGWFLRLVRRGKDVLHFFNALAGLAARAAGSGHRLCGQQSAKDALSPVAQSRHGFSVGRLASCGGGCR